MIRTAADLACMRYCLPMSNGVWKGCQVCRATILNAYEIDPTGILVCE